MDRKEEQRLRIKTSVKDGTNGKEILNMIRTSYGKDALSKSTIYSWIKRFKEGRVSVKDDVRSGRPLTSSNEKIVDQVRQKIQSDRKLTIREISQEVGISFGSCQRILVNELCNASTVCRTYSKSANDSKEIKRHGGFVDCKER